MKQGIGFGRDGRRRSDGDPDRRGDGKAQRGSNNCGDDAIPNAQRDVTLDVQYGDDDGSDNATIDTLRGGDAIPEAQCDATLDAQCGDEDGDDNAMLDTRRCDNAKRDTQQNDKDGVDKATLDAQRDDDAKTNAKTEKLTEEA